MVDDGIVEYNLSKVPFTQEPSFISINKVIKGCNLVHLDTFDFQAKDFYLKHGYEVFGVLDDCPMEHKRYYMKKNI